MIPSLAAKVVATVDSGCCADAQAEQGVSGNSGSARDRITFRLLDGVLGERAAFV